MSVADQYGPKPTDQGVRGYRALTTGEVSLINGIKAQEEETAALWGQVERESAIDPRWLHIARTHFQEGYSALVRSIAQPADPFTLNFQNNQQKEEVSANVESHPTTKSSALGAGDVE